IWSHAGERLRISSRGKKVTARWKRMRAFAFWLAQCRGWPGSSATDRSRRSECHGYVLHPIDEVGSEPLHLAVESNVGNAVEETVEHHTDLHAGQIRAQAEMRPA